MDFFFVLKIVYTAHVQTQTPPSTREVWFALIFLHFRIFQESKYFRMSYEDNIARLLIAEAYPEDEGEYTCTAENVAGSASCSCDLYIEGSNCFI